MCEGGEIDKEMTGTDDISPLSLPQMMMMGSGGDSDKKQGMDDDTLEMTTHLSDKPTVGTSMGQEINYELEGDTNGMDDVIVKNPGVWVMTMTRRSSGDDGMTRQGVMDDIMTIQSLSDNQIPEPSIGQRGGRDAIKNIAVHVCTVSHPEPLEISGGGGKGDNTPGHQEHRADTSSKGDNHPGGQTTNVDIRKPRVLHQMTLTGSRTSTPVRKKSKSSIASAKMMGGGGKGSGTPSKTRLKCSYTKEGICSEHGEGAKRHEKPVIETFVDKNGKERRRVKEKIVVYVCDTDLKGEKKLKQSTISFTKKQTNGEGGGDNTLKTGEDLGENSGSLCTSKVGKSNRPTMEK